MNNIKLIRLCSSLHRKNEKMINEDNAFIDEINDTLLMDDYLLSENAENPVMEVVFVESGGSEQSFKKLCSTLQKPVYLITTSQNNSFPACLEIRTYLANQNIECLLLFGEIKQIALNIITLANSFLAYRKNKNTRLGVIGRPSDWLIASKMDKEIVKQRYEVELVNIPLKVLYEEMDYRELLSSIPHYEELLAKGMNKEQIFEAINIYSALKRIIKKYDLKGFTIRCFDMLSKYKSTACLALALLNEEGYTATCEGDVPSLLTMHFVRLITDAPCFQANPSYVDMEKRQILFAHCTLPLNMCKSYSLDTHYESGLGIGVRGELELTSVNLLKIAPDYSFDNTLIAEGEIVDNPKLKNYCRTQIMVKTNDKGIFSTIFDANYGNHVIITYANCIAPFVNLLHLFDTNYQQKQIKKQNM